MPARTCSSVRRTLMDDWARYLAQGIGEDLERSKVKRPKRIGPGTIR